MALGLFPAAPGMVELAVTPRHGIAADLMGAFVIGFGREFRPGAGPFPVRTVGLGHWA